jgi:hypothetical protein
VSTRTLPSPASEGRTNDQQPQGRDDVVNCHRRRRASHASYDRQRRERVSHSERQMCLERKANEERRWKSVQTEAEHQDALARKAETKRQVQSCYPRQKDRSVWPGNGTVKRVKWKPSVRNVWLKWSATSGSAESELRRRLRVQLTETPDDARRPQSRNQS